MPTHSRLILIQSGIFEIASSKVGDGNSITDFKSYMKQYNFIDSWNELAQIEREWNK